MKSSMTTFFVGAAMLIVGLFWLSSIVTVTTKFGGGVGFGNFMVPGGLTLVPLICGIVWIFAKPESLGAKFLLGIGVLIIVAALLLSMQLRINRVPLYEVLLIFTFIAGGSGFLIRTFRTPKEKGPGEN